MSLEVGANPGKQNMQTHIKKGPSRVWTADLLFLLQRSLGVSNKWPSNSYSDS